MCVLCDPDSFSASAEVKDDVWLVKGVVVVGEDGEELDANKLSEYLGSDFSRIDYIEMKEGR